MIGYDGHKKVKGSKVHAAVTSDALPLSISVGRANEHDSRKLISIIRDEKVADVYDGLESIWIAIDICSITLEP